MKRIVCAFVGMSMIFREPFSFGSCHSDALDDFYERYKKKLDSDPASYAEYEKVRDRLYYGFIYYDEDISTFGMVDRKDAVEIAYEAFQMTEVYVYARKPEYLQSGMFHYEKFTGDSLSALREFQQRAWDRF